MPDFSVFQPSNLIFLKLCEQSSVLLLAISSALSPVLPAIMIIVAEVGPEANKGESRGGRLTEWISFLTSLPKHCASSQGSTCDPALSTHKSKSLSSSPNRGAQRYKEGKKKKSPQGPQTQSQGVVLEKSTSCNSKDSAFHGTLIS